MMNKIIIACVVNCLPNRVCGGKFLLIVEMGVTKKCVGCRGSGAVRLHGCLPSLPAPRCGALDALAEDSVAEEPPPAETASDLRRVLIGADGALSALRWVRRHIRSLGGAASRVLPQAMPYRQCAFPLPVVPAAPRLPLPLHPPACLSPSIPLRACPPVSNCVLVPLYPATCLPPCIQVNISNVLLPPGVSL